MQLSRPLCTEKRGRTLFLGLFLLGQSLDDFLLLGLEPLFPALSGFLGLRPAGLSLNPLVFEHVTLHLQVQAVIHVAVNLLRFTVSSEQPAQNSHPPHPGYLLGHSSIGSTLSLTYTHMPALPASQGVFPASSPGMDSHRLPDDQPIFDQLPDLLAGVGIGDFISLIGVQPDLLFATAKDAGGKPLLKPEHTHGRGRSGRK
ncbi:hypothetical protein G4228_014114 [Cervus hanglu yarkandensis]|nr:hypothetical protein G4228_014114 [Cervus hanglu yarkandensis]